LKQLRKNIISTYKLQNKNLQIICEVEPINIKIDLALPIALMINELIVNSIKCYDQYSKNAIIDIVIKRQSHKISFSYSDNFLRDEHFTSNYEESYAFNLVDALAAQLNGLSKFDLSVGMRFNLIF